MPPNTLKPTSGKLTRRAKRPVKVTRDALLPIRKCFSCYLLSNLGSVCSTLLTKDMSARYTHNLLLSFSKRFNSTRKSSLPGPSKGSRSGKSPASALGQPPAGGRAMQAGRSGSCPGPGPGYAWPGPAASYGLPAAATLRLPFSHFRRVGFKKHRRQNRHERMQAGIINVTAVSPAKFPVRHRAGPGPPGAARH